MDVFFSLPSHIAAIVAMALNRKMYSTTKFGTHAIKFVTSEVWYDISSVGWNKRFVNNANLIKAAEIPDILPSKSSLSDMNWAMKNNKRILGEPRFTKTFLKKCLKQ